MSQGFAKDELRKMLTNGAFLDGKSLEHLWNIGLGEYCGVSIRKLYTNGVSERFTSDVLNGQYSNERRYSRSGKDLYGLVDVPPFPATYYDGYVLEPLDKHVRVLSELIMVASEENLGPTFTLFENSLGGRVAVHGYSPWINIRSAPKRAQIMGVCDWVSRERMPVKIDKSVKVIPFIKVSGDGKQFLLMLLNASLDETGEFSAEMRVKSDRLYELHRNGSLASILSERTEVSDGKTVVKITNIEPWNFKIIRS
jgi:hypothetical protein